MEGIWLLFSILAMVPMFKLLPHFGINRYWGFACIIPLAVLGLLWWMSIRLQELERR